MGYAYGYPSSLGSKAVGYERDNMRKGVYAE